MAYQYLILDSRGSPVAHGISNQSPSDKLWRLEIDRGDVERVMSHTNINLVGTSDVVPALEGRIVRRTDNMVYVEPVRQLDGDIRRQLRMPVTFESYLYPISGKWKGRAPVVSYDLSCGGLAFYCARPLEEGELAQVVIPVTSKPLLLILKILYRREDPQHGYFYTSKYTGLLREEESMVQEAVFSLQLHRIG